MLATLGGGALTLYMLQGGAASMSIFRDHWWLRGTCVMALGWYLYRSQSKPGGAVIALAGLCLLIKDWRAQKVREAVLAAVARETNVGDVGETGSWPGFFSTPAGQLELLRTVDRNVTSLNASITGDPKWPTAPGDFQAGWLNFVAGWHTFFASNQSFIDRTAADTYDNAKRYESELAAWRERWKALGGNPPTPDPIPSNDTLKPPFTGEGIAQGAMGLGAIAVLLGAVYLFGRTRS